MSTDVSTRPRGCRPSTTRCWILVHDRVQFFAEAFRVDPRHPAKNLEKDFGGDEPARAHGGQLPDRDSVPGHDVGLASVEATHDLAAVIPQGALGYDLGHGPSVA